ncbi:DUF4393 domain-containing protein [Flavobacterium psychrophilum]|uniref:DUF4393 domain-containing protein n=1 Tax=Flavobacterium psychrophilum TaxID=96345 RepID=UPI0004F647B8|nr:DUF4393 domain-containing protein [Flavobacterium psychrophilum]AIN74099.1 hypothetical protein FPG3_07060 [Flavobacterium psychrophilum FPG3]EKT2070460.1 DUF4393 domain-containing protein [Flavobacterium psychrophilum]EKT2072799.1 DUF4393 domain-containing protein [Flavobacterium psychrophilum]EKT4492262.1 DUF4393 domain-containing protein [Flavobacterium psychrophilum]MBF2045584.1 DUF4393 domain-containing protein [Flavobacterium psychrophilum]
MEEKDTNIKATIDAVTGLVTAIPVYQDTLQPAAKQIGQSLETVTKTVNIALAPIKALVWGYEKIEEFITNRVAEKLKNIPEENITTPPTEIAGPAVEALRFSGNDINLRELYANLLASSMDINTQDLIHPGYVEIIKNLSSDEALLLKIFSVKFIYPLININAEVPDGKGSITEYAYFSHFDKITNLKRPDLIPTYVDNISRLGLTEIPYDQHLTAENTYEPLENDLSLSTLKHKIEILQNRKIVFERKVIKLTNFGRLFIQNVVNDK